MAYAYKHVLDSAYLIQWQEKVGTPKVSVCYKILYMSHFNYKPLLIKYLPIATGRPNVGVCSNFVSAKIVPRVTIAGGCIWTDNAATSGSVWYHSW